MKCDRKKIVKCLSKLPKNYFTRKMIDFHTFIKIALEFWEIWANQLLPKALKSCPKSNKWENLVTLTR